MTHNILLFLAAFLACSVEMVEALTIVLAVAMTRGWKPALRGVAAGLALLAVIVGALGPAVSRLPLNALRLVVGPLLLIFGLQWLRKAILRAGGLKALHDEAAIFKDEVRQLEDAQRDDRYGFVVAFKGVFLEGLEVAFLVVTFGGTQHRVGLAALAALCALVIVVGVGMAVRSPLTRVPENTLKFCVGLMLTTFGIFWSGEGAGVHWPGSDAALLWLLAVLGVVSLGLAGYARRPAPTVVGRSAAS
jgi:uncharacterized membrane protein